MCCCELLSQAADAQLPFLWGSAGRLRALGCGVPPRCGSPTVLGVAGTGEQVQRLGTTLGDETHPGECHSMCVSILFHNSIEKPVGARGCLPGGLLLAPRTHTKPQSGDTLGPLTLNCPFPVHELALKEQRAEWAQGAWCGRLRPPGEGSRRELCGEEQSISLCSGCFILSLWNWGSLPQGPGPFFTGAACIHPAYL